MEPVPSRMRAALDHVAVAVPDADAAEQRWRDVLGGRLVTWESNAAFHSRQLRFAGEGKLELLSPPDGADEHHFVNRFLDRFGASVHHITLKVDDLDTAIAALHSQGLDTVDENRDNDHWHEVFLRPSQVGGLVVQVAWSAHDDATFAASLGHEPQEPPDDGAVLVGPILSAPDLDHASRRWHGLGADVHPYADGLLCEWEDSPLGVVILEGEPAGPRSLLFASAEPLPADATFGAAVEVLGG